MWAQRDETPLAPLPLYLTALRSVHACNWCVKRKVPEPAPHSNRLLQVIQISDSSPVALLMDGCQRMDRRMNAARLLYSFFFQSGEDKLSSAFSTKSHKLQTQGRTTGLVTDWMTPGRQFWGDAGGLGGMEDSLADEASPCDLSWKQWWDNGNLDAVQSTIRWRAQVRSSKTIKIRQLSIILSIARGSNNSSFLCLF